MRVLGLCGSLRSGSYNRRLLHAAGAQLPDDVTFDIYVGLEDVPAYDEDLGDTPAAVSALRAAIAAADVVLVATPEYNSSLPGLLKNALDWASRPFPDNALRAKPAAVVGASTGLFGAVWAQAETRKVLNAIGADVLDEELPVGQAHQAFTAEGEIVDPDIRAALARLVDQLLSRAHHSVHVPAVDEHVPAVRGVS